MPEEKLDYSQMQQIEYKGKQYMYNPYSMGVGLWAEKTLTGKAGIYASKDLQKKLNKKAFGYDELPNMAERIESSSGAKKQRLKQTSVEWLQAKFQLIKKGYTEVPDTKSKNISGLQGMMFFYEYDPKYKETLPVWDKFPLVIILEQYSDGFLGLNLHYATEAERTTLLMGLLSTRIYSPELDKMKVNVDYERLVASAKRFPGFKKCIKRYLTQHIVGKTLEIRPHEWGLATFLPGADFHYNKLKGKK